MLRIPILATDSAADHLLYRGFSGRSRPAPCLPVPSAARHL